MMSGGMFVVLGLMGLGMILMGTGLMAESLKSLKFSEVIFRFLNSVIWINLGLLFVFMSNWYWVNKFDIYLPSATLWIGMDGGIIPDTGGRMILLLVSLLQLGVFISHRLSLRFSKAGK